MGGSSGRIASRLIMMDEVEDEVMTRRGDRERARRPHLMCDFVWCLLCFDGVELGSLTHPVDKEIRVRV